MPVLPAKSSPEPCADTCCEHAVASLRMDADSGHVHLIYQDDLSLSVEQRWYVEDASKAKCITVEPPENVRQLPLPDVGVSWTQRASAPGLLFESTWRRVKTHAEFAVRITNRGPEPQAVCLEQTILGFPLKARCFAPSMRADYDMTQSDVAFGYRAAPCLTKGLPGGALSIPMVSFYEPDTDLGFTVAAHIAPPTPPFACETERDRAVVRRRHVVTPGDAVTIRHHVIRHEGCWRPGLRWVRDAHPDCFMEAPATVDATHGCFVYTNTGDNALCDEFERQGVKNVEIHWTCPFFGKIVPEQEPWVKMVDDKWNAIKRTTDPSAPPEDAPYEAITKYVSKVTTPSGTRADVRAFIRRLQDRGMKAYMYFNPTESWEFFAAQEFPDCIVRRADGSPRMTWCDHVVMDCRPDSRWGQYLCEEIRQLLEIYPEADGIFMDQSASDPDDFRVCRITDAVARIVEQAGKTCYWNGPYMADLLPHAVGLLGELGPLQGERIKWLTVGTKVCCGLGHTEAQYQRNLLNGLWPPAPSLKHARSFRVSDTPAHTKPIPENLRLLHESYMPLYERFPGKTWFLGPNPIDVPDGTQGNIFETRDGDYLIPLIAPGHGIGDASFMENVTISVRVPRPDRIGSATVKSVNLPGKRYRAHIQCRNGQLDVTIPWMGAACLIELNRETPDADDMPPAVTSAGRTERRPPQVICAVIHSEGVAPTGNRDSIDNGLETTAPLPPVPVRQARLNGRPIGTLGSVNSWHWHPHVGVGVVKNIDTDITDILRKENELLIEPDGPEDFFKMRRTSMLVVFSDGRVYQSGVDATTYSSCPHAEAEGIVQSPIRIPIVFPDLPEQGTADDNAAAR